MDNVTEIKRQRLKKIYLDAGLDFRNLRFCFNPYQFQEVMQKILTSQKNASEVLHENRNLYQLGYLYEKTNQIYLNK